MIILYFRCDKVLKPKGIDIVHILTSPEKNTFDNILHSFVGIAAVQIGLTDVLRELGLVPDKIIGKILFLTLLSCFNTNCGYFGPLWKKDITIDVTVLDAQRNCLK